MMSSFDKKFDSLIKFPLKDIETATNNFSDENLIGKGSFGKIYKGQVLLMSGEWIDIVARRLDRRFGQGEKEFETEIMMISTLKHQNVLSIFGFCDENDNKIIINKLHTNGSLDLYLSNPTLTWTQRLHICLGIARALSYIHYDEGRKFSVIHGNIKSSKFLLDDKWEPKLFGFEHSKKQAVARKQGLVLSEVMGTCAYVDPAYVRSGGITYKSDVYSLGVVLFEVLCGRKAFIQAGTHEDLMKISSLNLDLEDHVGKQDGLDKTGPLNLDLEFQGRKQDELVKMGSQNLDLEYRAGKHDELVKTSPLSMDLKYQERESDDLVKTGPPNLDPEYQQRNHKEVVKTGSPNLDLEYQEGNNKELVKTGSPLLELEYKAEKHLEIVKTGSPNRDLQYQVGKHDELVKTGPLSYDLEYPERKPSALVKTGPPNLDLEYQEERLDELVKTVHVSLELEYQKGKLDELVKTTPLNLDLEYQAGKHDELVKTSPLSLELEYQEGKPNDLVKTVPPNVDLEYQGGKDDELVKTGSLLLELDYKAGKHKDLVKTRNPNLDLDYQANNHNELVKRCVPSQELQYQERKHDEVLKTCPPNLNLEYLAGKHDKHVKTGSPPPELKYNPGEHEKLIKTDPLNLNLEYHTDKHDNDLKMSHPYLDHNTNPPSSTMLCSMTNLPLSLSSPGYVGRSYIMKEEQEMDIPLRLSSPECAGKSYIIKEEEDMVKNLCLSASRYLGRSYIMDEEDMVNHFYPSLTEYVNERMSPSQSMFELRKMSNPGFLRESYSHEEEDEYMITLVGRQQWHIPKDGLLAKLAKSHYENETLDNIIHLDLRKQMDPESLKKFSEAAYCCLNEQRAQRPNIYWVIATLEQALEFQLAHEHSTVAVEENTSTNWKRKDLEHLRIGLDVIESAKKRLIGKGAFGSVYKAELDSSVIKNNKDSELPKRSITVAIKDIMYRVDSEGEEGCIAELEILSSCNHPNIVSLLGFCYEHPRMILVCEYVSNGSLEDYLESQAKRTNLTWVQRLKICIDVARGLEYIHSMDNKHDIIHRDIKSANILLGENWEAKIADFGLSIFLPLNHTKSTIVASTIAGTNPYLDPEYESSRKLNKKSDVYSFGVVLFEILTGRLAYDPVYSKDYERGLAPFMRQFFKNKGLLKDIIDPNLKEENDGKGPNKDSLHVFSRIGYLCLSETQEKRPKMRDVVQELEKALQIQETHEDSLRISFEDIRLATENFNNEIGRGGFGCVYRGEILRANGPTHIAVKRLDTKHGQGVQQFLAELQILLEYKHENIIGLLGYCNEKTEKMIIYEYASNTSLDRHLKDSSLTWTKRLKIAIDVAIGLEFLHQGDSPVIHRDIKSANILLNGDWKAKITDFGLSIITSLNNELDYVVDNACGTHAYVDPLYLKHRFLTRESDIYSLGVVLFEIVCGRMAMSQQGDFRINLVDLVKLHYEKGKFDEMVFEGIKDKIVPKSLTTFQRIAYQCILEDREERPTTSEVVSQLKKALEFQEDIEIWEAKLPEDYKDIIQTSKTPEILYNSNVSNKDLYEILSEGILLQKGKVCLSVTSDGKLNEMVSSTMFSYENNRLHKRIYMEHSRFKKVVKMMDISHLNIQIKIKTRFLSPNVMYGAYLVFKFCDPRKSSSKLMYVSLKYQMGSQTRHAYFATCGEDEWMMIELCRFIPHKKDVEFEVLLESLSRYYCGSGAIYVEGIKFQAINNDATLKVPKVDEKLKGEERVLKSNSDSVQQVSVDYDEITQLVDGEKLLSSSKADDKKWHIIPAKMVLYDTSDVNRFNWKSLAESRFQEAVELLSHQVLRIKCKIGAQKLSADTDYACYLIFKLSQKCDGLHCPVKVQDVLLWKKKEFKFLYFRSPSIVNFHGNERVPTLREDGLMEVIVWEFNSSNKSGDDHVPMSLKLRCYEGTMSGLIVYGIQFRPI